MVLIEKHEVGDIVWYALQVYKKFAYVDCVIYLYIIQSDLPSALIPFFITQWSKIWFLDFLNKFRDPVFKFLSCYILSTECPVLVWRYKLLFSKRKPSYNCKSFGEYFFWKFVRWPNPKFKRVIYHLFKCLF